MRHIGGVAAILFLALGSAPVQAAEPGFFVGLRANVVGSDGEPTNDMLGGGLEARFRLNERWWIGAALDQAPGFDVERPYLVLGLPAAQVDGEAQDAEGDLTAVTVWIERVYAREGRRTEWFWGAGVGAAWIDVEPVAGPLEGGGTFDIRQEVGTELLATLSGGLRIRLGERWRLVTRLRLEQHFTDWEVVDAVSGRRGEYDDYLVKGVSLGFEVGF